VSTGRLASAIALAAARRGDRVTLFLAEHAPAPRSRRIRIERFVTSADLRARLRAAAPEPDAIVHAAAISDYAPPPPHGARPAKVPSGLTSWTLVLAPLPKIVHELRRAHPRALLCMFKLESGIGRDELQRRATRAALAAGADLVFANLLQDVGPGHRGLLVDPRSGQAEALASREAAARAILRACRERVAARRRAPAGSDGAKS
jgi:phosphopantothenoylcysteine synthetase/decarboxylase